MKLRKLTPFLISVLSVNVFAFGGGGVVTDPGSYSYYGIQIEKAIEQIKIAEEQVKQATKTYEQVSNVDKRITGNVQRAQRNLQRIKDLQDLSLKDARKSLQFTKNALDEIAGIPEYKDDIEKNIDKTFGEETKKNNDWINVEAEKRAVRQVALKQAVVDAEMAHGKIEIQTKQLEELAVATNQTNDLKDATDVTNTALLSMLEQQQEMIVLLANISRSLAMADYNGREYDDPYMVNGKDLRNPDDFGVKPRGGQRSKSTSDLLKDCPLFTNCTYGN